MLAIPVVDGAEYYYEDGVNNKVSMTNELNWWSLVSHLVELTNAFQVERPP